jgi:hypothetical protein
MNYVYNDEDNAPMLDDPFDGPHNPTVYTSREEMRYFESGQYEQDLIARETAKEIRKCLIQENFMDGLEIKRGSECRKCPWLIEGILEQYEADEDLIMPAFCYDIAEGMCKVCKANPDRKDEAIEEYLKGVEEG